MRAGLAEEPPRRWSVYGHREREKRLVRGLSPLVTCCVEGSVAELAAGSLDVGAIDLFVERTEERRQTAFRQLAICRRQVLGVRVRSQTQSSRLL